MTHNISELWSRARKSKFYQRVSALFPLRCTHFYFGHQCARELGHDGWHEADGKYWESKLKLSSPWSSQKESKA